MRTDGWLDEPVEVVEHNGQLYIINGHHRVEAARRAGIEVQYKIVGLEVMAKYNYHNIEDVLRASSEAGLNRLRR